MSAFQLEAHAEGAIVVVCGAHEIAFIDLVRTPNVWSKAEIALVLLTQAVRPCKVNKALLPMSPPNRRRRGPTVVVGLGRVISYSK